MRCYVASTCYAAILTHVDACLSLATVSTVVVREDTMLLINWTGMNKTYWMPVFKWKAFGKLWFFEIKFLLLQITLYSVELGRAANDKFNAPRIISHADPDQPASIN